jgi:hypothetical protein
MVPLSQGAAPTFNDRRLGWRWVRGASPTLKPSIWAAAATDVLSVRARRMKYLYL